MVAQSAGGLNREGRSPPGKDSPYLCQSPLRFETWRNDKQWPVREGGVAAEVENNSSLDVDLCLTRRTLRAHHAVGGKQRRSQVQGWRKLMEGRRSATPGLPAVSRSGTLASPVGKRPSSLPATSPPPWSSPSPHGATPSLGSTALPSETPPPASARASSARSTPCREASPQRPASQAMSARGAESPAPLQRLDIRDADSLAAPPLRADIRAHKRGWNARPTWEASALPPRPGSQMQMARRGEVGFNATGNTRSASRAGAGPAAGSSTASPFGTMSHPRTPCAPDPASELAAREALGRRTSSSLGNAGPPAPGGQNSWTGGDRPSAARSELVRWCFRNDRHQIQARLSLLDRSSFSEAHRSHVYKEREGGLPDGSEALKLLRLYEQMGLKALPPCAHTAALESWGAREGGCSRTSELLMAFEVLNFYRWLCGVHSLQIDSCRQELSDFLLHVLMKRDPRVHMRPEGAPHLCEFLSHFGAYVNGDGGRAVVVSQVPAAPAAVRLLFSGLPGSSGPGNEHLQSNVGANSFSASDQGNIGGSTGAVHSGGAADHGGRGMPHASHTLHGADLPMLTLPGADARTEALDLPLATQDALRGYVPFLRLSRLGSSEDSTAEAWPFTDAVAGDSVTMVEGIPGGRVRCVPVDECDMPDPVVKSAASTTTAIPFGVTLKPSQLAQLEASEKKANQAKDARAALPLSRRRRTRAWGDTRGVVAFRRSILDPRLRTTGLMRRGCRTCFWTDTEQIESPRNETDSPSMLQLMKKKAPDVNFLDVELVEEVERLKSSEALQKLHGWREEMSRRLTPGVVGGSESMMGFQSAGDTFAEASDSVTDPWVSAEQGESFKKEAFATRQTTNIEERVKEVERRTSRIFSSGTDSPDLVQDESEPLMVCFPPPGIVPIDEIEVASLLWTISPDPQRLAPTSRCKVQVFRVSIDVERGKADRTSDEEVPLGSFCVDCTDVGTPFCVIFSLGVEIEDGDQFEVVLSGLMGLQPAELISALRYFVSFESFLPSVHDMPPLQQRASQLLAWFKTEYLWADAQWHCPGEAPGEDEFFALVSASRAARERKTPTPELIDKSHNTSVLDRLDKLHNAHSSGGGHGANTFGSGHGTHTSGSTHGAHTTPNATAVGKAAERFVSGLSSVYAAAQPTPASTFGRGSFHQAVSRHLHGGGLTSGHAAHEGTGSKALLGRFRPPQVNLVQRTEFSTRSPPPFGLVPHPNGSGSPSSGQGRYTIDVPSGNEVCIALLVPSTVIAKASIMYFVKSSAKWEVFSHGVFAMYLDSAGGSEAPQSLLGLLANAKAKLPQCPRKRRMLLRVMLPMAGRYELRFHWGFIPGDTTQCRGVSSSHAVHEHPLRIAISLGAKVPMYRPLVPTFFHASTKRLGYPMKHPLAEHYGVTLVGPMRYRLRVDTFVRFTVLANQGKPVTAKSFAATADAGLASLQDTHNQEAIIARKVVDAHAEACSARLRERSNSASSSANDESSRSNSARTSPTPGLHERTSFHSNLGSKILSEGAGGKVRFKDANFPEPSQESASGSDRDSWFHGDGLKGDALLEAVQQKIAEQIQRQVRSGTAGQICIIAVLGTWRRVVLLRRRLLEPPPPPPEVADLAATAGSAVAAEAAMAAVARNTEVHEAIVCLTDEDQNQPVQLYVFQVGAAEAADSSSVRTRSTSESPQRQFGSQSSNDGSRGNSKGPTTAHQNNAASKESMPGGTAPPLGRMLPPARWCLAEFFVEGAHPLPYDEDEMNKPLPLPADPVEILGFDKPA